MLDFDIFVTAVAQSYSTKAEDEYVIMGNDVLMKCKIPSFVSDFVAVSSWSDSEGMEFYSDMSKYGKCHDLKTRAFTYSQNV